MTSETQHSGVGSGQPEPRHESYALHVRPLVLFGVGLAVLTVVSFLLMGRLFHYFDARQTALDVPVSPLAADRHPPPEPHLQIAPHKDLRKLRESEEAILHSYGWVNRDTGLVRIPIDRAIELLAERGLPTRSGEAHRQ
jgi:hypothetical protein